MAEITVTNDNFQNEIMDSDLPVLIDFWASWCGPCKMIAPIVEEIAEEYDGVIKVGKVNVDEEPFLAAQFGVVSIPTLIVIKDGRQVNSAVGYRTKEDIIKLLNV
mgnify:FL=1